MSNEMSLSMIKFNQHYKKDTGRSKYTVFWQFKLSRSMSNNCHGQMCLLKCKVPVKRTNGLKYDQIWSMYMIDIGNTRQKI